MKLKKHNKKYRFAMTETIILTTTDKLDIVKTFECGQCFRWNRGSNGVYCGVASGYAAKIWNDGKHIFIRSDAPKSFWENYFDLSRDYAAITDAFDGGEYLKECIDFGFGIRILRQDSWEALCSFIISQCNNISRIKGIVERLCQSFGERFEMDGEVFYTFPSAEALSRCTEDDLSVLRCGYRAAYIITASKAVASGEIDLEHLVSIDWKAAKKELLSLYGIGEKVANCVVLFGLYHMEAFPIDTWIRKALKAHFPADFDPASLGEYAGLAQQYIFYYARSGENNF